MEIEYSLFHHPLVIKEDIPRLDQFWRHEIRDAVRAKLLTQPQLFGKPLRGTLKGCRTLRVGDYRIVFKIDRKAIHIVAIIHRSTDYRGIERRI